MKDLHSQAIRLLEAIEFTKKLLLHAKVNEERLKAIFLYGSINKYIPKYENRIVRLKEYYREVSNLINVKNHQNLNK